MPTGTSRSNPDQATDIYTEQCSVSVNAKDLATMAATLANGGTNPVTGKAVLRSEYVPEVLAVMATAGLYDDSGKWLYKTGLPAKSGVGGGIIAVVAGQVRYRRHRTAARCGRQQRQGAEDHRGRLQRARCQSVRRDAGGEEEIGRTAWTLGVGRRALAALPAVACPSASPFYPAYRTTLSKGPP